MINKISVGDEIGISQEITDCGGSIPKNWTKTYASIGGDYHFLKGGVIQSGFSNDDAAVPNSRTAIAYNNNYVYYIVVDGWNKWISEGIKVSELATFARSTLLATDGVTLDSGGSSTMVINGHVVNNTYCNFTRDCGMKPEEGEIPSHSSYDIKGDSKDPGYFENSPESLEPLVGNSMMMVVVEPMSRSQTFQPTQSVITTEPAALRQGPGTNYPALVTIPTGFEGIVVMPFYSDVSGVLAKGSYWWKVDFAGSVGWVRENSLRAGGIPPAELSINSDSPTLLGEVTTLEAVISDERDPTYTWKLGDGTNSSGEVVEHTYQNIGGYNVTLTAWFDATILRANNYVIVSDLPFSFNFFFPLVNR
jgi:hypothetical protein